MRTCFDVCDPYVRSSEIDVTNAFLNVPTLPDGVIQAANSGNLVVFTGAGISRLAGGASWSGFAENVMRQLLREGAIDHYGYSQLKIIPDPKKQLSIARIIADKKSIEIRYAEAIQAAGEKTLIYDALNLFSSSFVTTNYDKLLCPSCTRTEEERKWRHYGRSSLLRNNLDGNGRVIHLHGCIDDPKSMIVTTREYLEHYSSFEVQEFLRYVFQHKVVLFLGYGLEEMEILEYILRRGREGVTDKGKEVKHFILQGFFHAETALCRYLQDYYLDAFAAELIAFAKDNKGHEQQVDIVEAWSGELRFGSLTTFDQLAALEEEING